jgi:hypothetical protein
VTLIETEPRDVGPICPAQAMVALAANSTEAAICSERHPFMVTSSETKNGSWAQLFHRRAKHRSETE